MNAVIVLREMCSGVTSILFIQGPVALKKEFSSRKILFYLSYLILLLKFTFYLSMYKCVFIFFLQTVSLAAFK